jgi:hypothetical protein
MSSPPHRRDTHHTAETCRSNLRPRHRLHNPQASPPATPCFLAPCHASIPDRRPNSHQFPPVPIP